MTTREQWLALAARCEKATGPDREIDYAIIKALGFRWVGTTKGPGLWWVGEGVEPIRRSQAKFTDSLDAITALIERELPGLVYTMTRFLGGKACIQEATFYSKRGDTNHGLVIADPECASLALALSWLFCRAKAELAGDA